MQRLIYRGMSASIAFDPDDQLLVGHMDGIAGKVGFHGMTIEDAQTAFQQAVDNYLDQISLQSYTTVYSSVKLIGFKEKPDQISSIIGVTPTNSFVIGQVPRSGAAPYRSNGWILKMETAESASISDHISAAIEKCRDRFRNLKSIACERTIACGVYMYGDDRPPLYLEASLVESVAEAGFALDIDLYNLPFAKTDPPRLVSSL